MFQVHGLRALQEDAQDSLLAVFLGIHGHRIFLPLLGIDGDFLLIEVHVPMCGAKQVHQFHADFGRSAVRNASPDRETVCFSLLDTNAEEAFIFQHGTLVGMAWVGQTYIVRIPFKRAILPYGHVTGTLPALQRLWKLKGTVFHQFGIESAVGSKVDVFKEDAIHGRLNHCTRFLGIDDQFLGGFLC